MSFVNLKLVFFFLFYLKFTVGIGCQCPLTMLSIKECDKYEIIFKGKIISVAACDNKFGVAVFEVQELYKGNATKNFKVLFECNVPCSSGFNIDEEWIIYSNYKQIDNAMMDWCSRSRKYFKNTKEDFYTVTYGNDYFDEVKFLQKKLGLHRTISQTANASENRNVRPTTNQTIIILLSSISVILIFYWLFKKYFKL